MSGRARVRAYHSLSTRDTSMSLRDMFLDHDVTLSITPLIVTFGWGPAGCCASASGTRARMTTTEATAVRNFLMLPPPHGEGEPLERLTTYPWSNTNTYTHQELPGNLYSGEAGGSRKKARQRPALSTVSEGLQPLRRCLPERRLGREIADPAECGSGLVPAVLGCQYKTKVVVRRLLTRIEADRKP